MRDYPTDDAPKYEGNFIDASTEELQSLLLGAAEKRGFFDIIGGCRFEFILCELEERGAEIPDFTIIERDYFS